MTCCHNSRYTLRFFSTFFNERGQEAQENCINGFSEKKICLGLMSHFGSKNSASSKLCTSKSFLKIQAVDQNYINAFSKKVLVQGKWSILGVKILQPHNSGSTLTIF